MSENAIKGNYFPGAVHDSEAAIKGNYFGTEAAKRAAATWEDYAAWKDDLEKLARFDLIPPGPLWELAEQFGVGAKEHGPRNWELGMSWARVFAAMERHSWSWFRGEQRAVDNKRHHLAAVAWCALVLMEYERTHPELDDRPKPKGPEAVEHDNRT